MHRFLQFKLCKQLIIIANQKQSNKQIVIQENLISNFHYLDKYNLPFPQLSDFKAQQQMSFPYVVQLQNIDTNEKVYHCVNSSQVEQVFNSKQKINVQSVMAFILMYEPQCDDDMLLIMYQEQQNWLFMTSAFFVDLRNIQGLQQNSSKMKITKFTPHMNNSITNSQSQFSALNSTKLTQRPKANLHVRYQCQLWVEEHQNLLEKSLLASKTSDSQREQLNVNVVQKLNQIKTKIKQIDNFSQKLHRIQAQTLGINIFWASPFYATDGILRKQPKGFTKKKQYLKKDSKDYLKNSVKCMPYVNAVTHQIKRSKKKVVLNIDQFNKLSFARRNIFKVVYLICHTEVIQISAKQYQERFQVNLSSNQTNSYNYSSIKVQNLKNSDSLKKDSGKIDDLQLFQQIIKQIGQSGEKKQLQIQNSQNDKLQISTGLKFKKTESLNLQEESLQNISQQNQSERLTQRKLSRDTQFLHNINQSNNHIDTYTSEQKPIRQHAMYRNQESDCMQDAFGMTQYANLFNPYQHQQYKYQIQISQRTKQQKARLSRSKSLKSSSSIGNRNKSKSSGSNSKNKYNKGIKSNQMNQLQQKQLDHTAFGVISPDENKYKKNKNKNKQKFNQTKRKKQFQQAEITQKPSVTYLIGQNKLGQLVKITPQDLDQMLSLKKLENIELFIIHASFPYAHLPILKKHANNIIVINSNPIYPEACTVYFIKYFFRYLLQLKNVRTSYEKALFSTSQLYCRNKDTPPLNFSNLYSSQKQPIQRLSFQPFMQKINKRFIHGGPYLCCCYHPHEPWCNLRNNKATSKYAEAHYKFHVNRCQCEFQNPMQHSCKFKLQNNVYNNVIDKKNYTSEIVYDCCCQGVMLGRYKHRQKNTKYNQITNHQNSNDPHDYTHKYVLLKQYSQLNNRKLQHKESKQESQKKNSDQNRNKQLLQITQGQVEGSCNTQFLESIKYLSQNQLIANTQIIVQLLSFFGSDSVSNVNDSQMGRDIQMNKSQMPNYHGSMLPSKIVGRKQIKVTNSMIRQSIQANASNDENVCQVKKNFLNQPRICNIYGQNSIGRKTISKYLGNLMIIKNMYDCLVIKTFTKVQDLKYIYTQEKLPYFYILIYKSAKRHQQINLNQIMLTASRLPPSINAIIVTNKKIKFDSSVKFKYETPRPFNKQQIKTYIKMYEHLSPQQKLKLDNFMKLTELEDKNQSGNQLNKMKIYANRIDPYEVISILRRSNYSNKRYEKYFESLSKMHSQCLPQYLFIAGTIYQTLKYFDQQSSSSMRRKKRMLVQSLQQKMKSFMSQNRAFFFLFDPKKNKKQKNKNTSTKSIKTEHQFTEVTKQKPSQKQQEKQFKQQIIRLSNISSFFILVFQKFRRQISRRCLDPLKMYIYYTTIRHNGVHSLRQNHFLKENLHHRNLQSNTHLNRTRNIAYEKQFYEATSLNQNSFILSILGKQIKQYGQLFNSTEDAPTKQQAKLFSQKQLQKYKQLRREQMSKTQQSPEPNDSLNYIEKFTEQYFTMQKKSLNQFFFFYVETLRNNQKDAQENTKCMDINNRQLMGSRKMQIRQGSIQNLDLNRQKLNYFSPQSNPRKQRKTQSFSLPMKQNKSENMKQKKGLGQQQNYEKNKNKNWNFHKEQLHLHYIMSSGLLYLRSIVCSHLTFNLLRSQQTIEIIKAGLILINNALILMKTPQNFNQHQESSHHTHSQPSQEQEQNKKCSQDSFINSQFRDEVSSSRNIMQSSKNNISNKQQRSHSKSTKLIKSEANKKRDQKLQNKLDKLFTVQGLLYLLFKIRERCDGLILTFTNNNSFELINRITQLCIISELLIIQLHLMNLFKGQNYEEKILKFKTFQKTQKYLNQIFYDKARSINYLKEVLYLSGVNREYEEIIQNHLLSAYILIATNCGRKKVNQKLCVEINKMKKDFDDKSGEEESNQELIIDNKFDQNQLSSKMKVLLKISQNKQIFLRICSIFMSFAYQQQQSRKSTLKNQNKAKQNQRKQINTRTHKPTQQLMDYRQINFIRQISYQSLTTKLYKSQNQVYLKLLQINHILQHKLQEEEPLKLQLQLQMHYKVLLNDKMISSLSLCSRYINDFNNDILNKIREQKKLLRQKFVLILTADPIQFPKSTFSNSGKKSASQNHEDPLNNKKKISFEGKNKTIILSSDLNQLNQKFKTNDCFSKEKQLNKNQQNQQNQQIQGRQEKNLQKGSSKPLNVIGAKSYNFFSVKRKLNQTNLKQLSCSFGCRYLCIDTMMCVSNYQNQIIGQSQQGETLIYSNQQLSQLIYKTLAVVLFICLPNANLAKELIKRGSRKQMIYFNFQRNPNQSWQKRQLSSSHRANESGINMRFTYYRMVMQKTITLIILRIAANKKSPNDTVKLQESFQYVVSRYQFCIRNQQEEVVFHLSNKQLRKSIFLHKHQLQEMPQDVRPKLITLFQGDIASVEQVQQVKTVLKHKYNNSRGFKDPIGVKNIKSFHKFFKILKFYLKDKQSYQHFFQIDLQKFKYPNKDKEGVFPFRQAKSNSSIPSSLSREESKNSSESEKKKRQKRHKQAVYENVKYTDKWRSQFFKFLLKQNIFNFFLSNRKGLVMFLNSELMMSTEKGQKQDWTRKLFQNLFKVQTCDNSEQLNRSITSVKIGILKDGDKRLLKQATLYFMENVESTNQ